MSEKNAKSEWMKKNRYVFTISIMRRTEPDIIERLEREENKAGYIKRLIREDIEREKDK